MIRRKLYDIKLILRIIISCFIVVNMVRSCAKAVTYNEIKDYVDSTADLYNENTHYQIIKSVIDSNTTKSWIEGEGTFQYYSNIYIYRENYNNSNLSLVMYNAANGWSTTTNSIIGTGKGHRWRFNGTSWYYSNGGNMAVTPSYAYSTTENDYNNLMGMNFTYNLDEANSILPVTYVGLQALNQNPLSFGHSRSEDYIFNNETIQAIKTSYNYTITPIENVLGYTSGETIFLSLYDLNDNLLYFNQYIYNDNIHVGRNSNGNFQFSDLDSYGNIDISTRLIDFNTLYKLQFSQGENSIIEKIIFLPLGTVITGGVITYIPSGDFSYNTQQSTNDIIASVNDIVGTLPIISTDLSGDFSGDLSSEVEAGSGILGGIFSLFVPDGNFFRSYFNDLNSFFSVRLGILYLPFDFIISFLSRVLTIDFSNPVMTLGPYTLPLNDNFELVPLITIDFNSYLEESNLKDIHDTYLMIMDGLLIIGYIKLLSKTYKEFIGKGGN